MAELRKLEPGLTRLQGHGKQQIVTRELKGMPVCRETFHNTVLNTTASAKTLKELLGTVELEPVSDKDSVYYALLNDSGKKFKPYYAARHRYPTAETARNELRRHR